MPWLIIVVLTIAGEYVLGMIVVAIYHFAHTGWYDPKRISPRPTRWAYRWWGRPLAVLADCALWPVSLAEACKR